MMRTLLILAALLAGASVLLLGTACGGEAEDALIITAIPDGDEDDMRAAFGALAKHLEEALGMPVRYEHVQDYRASVTALANDQAQLAWFGAVTTAQAWEQMGDRLEVIGCRDIDKKFVAYYIANNSLEGLPEGEVEDLGELADLAEEHGWTLTFGSASSTSSHGKPHYFFLEQAERSPHDVFENVGFSGDHDTVRRYVADGTWDIGTLSDVAYERGTEEELANLHVIYRTPQFINYSLSTHTGVDEELRKQIREAVLSLHDTEEGRQLLEYLGAETFIEAELEEWRAYREILDSGILETGD